MWLTVVLQELTKTKYVTPDGNIPSHVVIENLKRICENWLEDLRYSYNMLYVWNVEGGMRNENTHDAEEDEPIAMRRYCWISLMGRNRNLTNCY